jgi:hypothetical protein
MNKNIVKTLAATVLLAGGMAVAGCSSDADVASKNLSKDADNFKIFRKVVFYNGITGEYVAEVDGFCSIGNHDSGGKLSITCKMSDGKYIKNYLGLSDNVTWFALQTETADVSTQRYKVILKPTTLVPDFEVR